MANILANHTAAFIFYGGEWNDTSDEIRTTNTVGSTMFLEFSGTNFSAFGLTGLCARFRKFNPPNVNATSNFGHSHISPPSGDVNAPVQSPQTPGQPFLALQNLAKGYHNITLNLTHGTLGLSRLMWFDPEASATNVRQLYTQQMANGGRSVSPALNFGNTSVISICVPRATNTTLANITFSFQGTGIVIVGQTGPEGGSFK
ncbi:hypothetical protein FRC10_011978 [Ceratobasidium sp. 414]|nr:hypothetical protein FRC10_011978 [Ceratobasidium sp. 414]